METFILIGCVLAIAFLVVGISGWREQRRIAALVERGRALGYSPVSTFNSEHSQLMLSPMLRSNQGYTPTIVCAFEVGSLHVAECQYVVGSGKHRRTHRYCAILQPLSVALPSFVLREEGWLDKAASVFGFDDLDFPALPHFSKRFHVKGENATALERYFSHKTRRDLQELPNTTVLSVGTHLVVAQEGNRLTADELEQVVSCLKRKVAIFTV